MQNDPIRSISNELLEVQRTLGWMDLVLGSINDAVYVTASDERIVFANQYFANLIGEARVFLLGERLDDVFRPKPAQKILAEFSAPMQDSLHSKEGVSGIYEWSGKDGILRIFRISSQQLSTTHQTVYLAQNITREYELAKMKGSFIDLASHQLRTPMTAVMTYAHMLQDGFAGELNPQQQKLSATIIESSERMIKLVNDLLTITRAQNNTKEMQLKPVTMQNLFQRIGSEVRASLESKNLKFQVDIPVTFPQFLSDRNLLHEIFLNLVVNAIQYTPDNGKIHVIVKQSGRNIEVTVADTGIGIPDSHIPNMFNQFSRAENAATAHPDGTGLGLFIIKLLLDKIDGSISYTSKINQGTTFTVRLPLKQVPRVQ